MKKREKQKVVLTTIERDKKIVPNAVSVINAGNTIGMEFQNEEWIFSFNFVDKGRLRETIQRPGSENILFALNGACATFEEEQSDFEGDGLEEIIEKILEEIEPLISFLKSGEDLWIEKDDKITYLFKCETLDTDKVYKETVIEALIEMSEKL